jgi:WhiB family redox-sensing transcriptional regulator
MPREDDWTAQASCKGQPDLFFPPFGERPHTREAREAQAKEICAACPVQQECLWFGRRHHEYGVWGGENELERVNAGYGLLAPIGTRHLSPMRSPERRSA